LFGLEVPVFQQFPHDVPDGTGGTNDGDSIKHFKISRE
jgi:hypothetical protein